MQLKSWSKTLLTVYRHLEKIYDAIDGIILSKAKNSDRFKGDIANKIINLTERKITLINLKILIENVLVNLDPVSARILVLKHIDKMKSDDIAKVMGLSNRTFFRKASSALTSFEKELKKQGYTSQSLSDMLKNEFWIKSLFNKIYSKELSKISKKLEFSTNVSSKAIINSAYAEYKKADFNTISSTFLI